LAIKGKTAKPTIATRDEALSASPLAGLKPFYNTKISKKLASLFSLPFGEGRGGVILPFVHDRGDELTPSPSGRAGVGSFSPSEKTQVGSIHLIPVKEAYT
jgi:hypothetical protein